MQLRSPNLSSWQSTQQNSQYKSTKNVLTGIKYKRKLVSRETCGRIQNCQSLGKKLMCTCRTCQYSSHAGSRGHPERSLLFLRTHLCPLKLQSKQQLTVPTQPGRRSGPGGLQLPLPIASLAKPRRRLSYSGRLNRALIVPGQKSWDTKAPFMPCSQAGDVPWSPVSFGLDNEFS